MINSLSSNSTLHDLSGPEIILDNDRTEQKSEPLELCCKPKMCLSCVKDIKDMKIKIGILERKFELLSNRMLLNDDRGISMMHNNLCRNSLISSSSTVKKHNLLDKCLNSIKKYLSCGCNNCSEDTKMERGNRHRSQSFVSELKPHTDCINHITIDPTMEIKCDQSEPSSFTKDAIKEFCETTSFHGFPEWYRANKIHTKTLWVLIIIFGMVGTSYEIFTVINDYRTAPTSTSYEFESPGDGMVFPQIVLCNTNFLNSSKVRTLNMSHSVVNAAKFLILNPIEDVIGGVFDSNSTYLSKILAKSDAAASDNAMPEVLDKLKYDQNEFIKACFFDQQLCETYNISIQETPDAEYGICYLISINSLQTKSSEGLQLVLDTHTDLWWTELPTFGHGVVVRIEKTYNPSMLRSYYVLPNHITKISLSATHYNMLDDSSSCRHDMERNIFNYNVTYSEDMCRMECFFPVTLKHCGCIRSTPPEYLYQTNLPQCFNSTQQLCLKQAVMIEKQDPIAQECKRQCLPPCDFWDYRTSMSMLKFPAVPIIPVMEEICNKFANESRFEDYVILDIAFDQLRIDNIKQQVSITPDGFLSQIGGHLGLFLGASIMSVVQLFIIFCQWLFRCLALKLKENCRQTTVFTR